MDWIRVGEVVHYYDKINVAIIELDDTLALGDTIGFVKGEELLFEQEVTSMQVEHQNIDYAEPGESIGLETPERLKAGTEVYKLA